MPTPKKTPAKKTVVKKTTTKQLDVVEDLNEENDFVEETTLPTVQTVVEPKKEVEEDVIFHPKTTERRKNNLLSIYGKEVEDPSFLEHFYKYFDKKDGFKLYWNKEEHKSNGFMITVLVPFKFTEKLFSNEDIYHMGCYAVSEQIESSNFNVSKEKVQSRYEKIIKVLGYNK